MVMWGRSADNRLVEIIELADHPWFVGTQFHPEFKSRPTRAHPLFRDFIGAAAQRAGLVGGKSQESAAPTVEAESPLASAVARATRNGHSVRAHQPLALPHTAH